MNAPRTLRAAAVVGAIFLLVLTSAPAHAGSPSALRAGKLQGQKAIGPNMATPPEGKVGTSQAIAPNYLLPKPNQPPQAIAPNHLLPKQNLPSASGLPTGKRQHKPVIMTKPLEGAPSASGQPAGKGMHLPLHVGTEPLVSGEKPPLPLAQPPAGASSQALNKIPTHQPPWSNPKLHGEGLPEPEMVHPPDPINPASKVGGATPDPGIKPASELGGVAPDDGKPASQAASGEGLATMGEPASMGVRNEMLNNKYPENMKHE